MRGRITHDTNPDRTARKGYRGVVLDSPTPPVLARFYATLLEWEIGAQEEGWVTIRPVELGAVPAEFQPQDDVRVMLDPDGHPFCLDG